MKQCFGKLGKGNVSQTSWPLTCLYTTWPNANWISLYYKHASIDNTYKKFYNSSLRFCKE